MKSGTDFTKKYQQYLKCCISNMKSGTDFTKKYQQSYLDLELWDEKPLKLHEHIPVQQMLKILKQK